MFGLGGALARTSIHVLKNIGEYLTDWELSYLEFPLMRDLCHDPFYDGGFCKYTDLWIELPTLSMTGGFPSYTKFPYHFL